ncbi:GNAT family N-acetyltransferase [Aquimarina sp. I32.4]|uniref:GNAT family N-acetyltransferase n=1 Tax=Aquimarina sp. I32.4 TaxID=2053903 RepID=UPI0035138722
MNFLTIMIRKALSSDLTAIHSLTQDCAKAMIANGIHQWNEHYPTQERFEKDVQSGELYLYEENKHLIGIIVLTDFMDDEYISVKWLTNNHNNLYVHRVAVHPLYWGQGYAQQIMTFAEQYAKENQYQSIRLDTFSQNKRNQKFYEIRGYQRLDDIYFPKQSEHPFHCYELTL